MIKYVLLLCSMAATGFAEAGTLTLEQALELARKNSPELRAARLNTQAAEKSIGAAGLWTNPELEFEAENMGGDLDLFSAGEYTVGLVQEFQLGGKRKRDRTVALKSRDAASQAALEKELELDAKVRVAFIELMVQQETGKVRTEQEQLGRAFVEVAKQRHKAGGGSELDVVQAELALEEIILSQTCCFGDLEAAKVAMASLIGIPVQEVAELTAPYYELESPEGLAVDNGYPALQRLEAEAETVRAEARRAKAEDTANVSLGAGYRYGASEEINTFVFSASMPLSFNKRGHAEYAAGMLRAEALQAGHDELRRQLQRELASLLALYKGAKTEVELTKSRLIPKATQAYELSREGYSAGRFSWLELIAAQQNLADIRIRYIESLRDAHLAYAQLSKFIKEGI